MKKYKNDFKEMFLAHSISSIQNKKIESEFIKYFDTENFIMQFSKAIAHLTEKMNIDSKEQIAILGLAKYLLAEIKQEMLNEVDKYSLGRNDNISEDRELLQDRIEFFTHYLNYNLFGRNDSKYQSLFEFKSSKLIQDTAKPICEYQNYLFDIIFSKYHYLMLIGGKKFSEAQKLQREQNEKLASLAKKYASEAYQLERENKNLKGITNIKNTISKAGPKPKFKSESELHEAIRKIPNWKKLSPENISIELGFSKSWLRGFINDKSRNWTLPKKES